MGDSVSLGQGQGPKAEKLMVDGKKMVLGYVFKMHILLLRGFLVLNESVNKQQLKNVTKIIDYGLRHILVMNFQSVFYKMLLKLHWNHRKECVLILWDLIQMIQFVIQSFIVV